MSGGFNSRDEFPPLLFGSAAPPLSSDREEGNPLIDTPTAVVFDLPGNLVAVGFKKSPDEPFEVFRAPDPDPDPDPDPTVS